MTTALTFGRLMCLADRSTRFSQHCQNRMKNRKILLGRQDGSDDLRSTSRQIST